VTRTAQLRLLRTDLEHEAGALGLTGEKHAHYVNREMREARDLPNRSLRQITRHGLQYVRRRERER
jgi:hypothetical protein